MAQIGTVEVETQNSGVVQIPVFNTGDSGSDVYEFVRVQTPSGVGFVPVVDPADADYPYLRVQSQNNGVVAVHTEASLFPTAQGNLIYWYKYPNQNNPTPDEANGADFGSTTAHDASLFNSPKFDSAQVLDGFSMGSDGTNRYADVPNTELPSGTSPRSMSVWVYVKDTGGRQCPIAYGNSTGGEAFEFEVGDVYAPNETNSEVQDTIGIHTWGSSVFAPSGTLDYNQWNHIAVTYDGTDWSGVQLYYNGSPVTSNTDPNGNTWNTVVNNAGLLSSLSHNTNGSVHNLNGYTDDVRVYNTDLTDAQVQRIYDNTTGTFEAPTFTFSEDFNTFDTNVWTLYGDASYDSANNRVELNTGTGGTGGTVVYEDGITDVFDVDLTFTNGADGADEVSLLFKYDALQNDGANNIWRPENGYTVDFDHYNDQIELVEYTNGSATSLASTAQTIGSGTFSGRVEYDNGSVTVDFEGSQVLTYTISSPNNLEGFGYSGRDGGVTGAHYLESTTITGVGDGTTDGGLPTPDFTNPSFESYTDDGSYNRPDNWTYFDSTNTGAVSGAFNVRDPSSNATDGSAILYNEYTANNSGGEENRIEQDIDLTNINTILVDRYGDTNSFRSELVLRVNGTDVQNWGTFTDGQTDTDLSADVSSYSGTNTVAFVWDQVAGDNLGTSGIDNVRTQ